MRMPLRRSLLWFVLLSCLYDPLCFGKQQPIVKDTVRVSTPYGSFDFKNISVTSAGAISATVVNNTTRSWKYAQFLVYLKDKKGKFLPLSPYGSEPYSLVTGVKNISKGQTGQVETGAAPSFQPVPGKFTDFEVQFNPTNSDFAFNYVFTLVSPRENSSPVFDDDTISLVFVPSNQQIVFQLQNRSASPIKLDWDQMAYVDFDGSSHRVIHQGVRLIQRDAPQSPTVVAPYSSVKDFLYPSDRVSWNSTISEWMEEPIWSSIPTVGQKFGVFMPIEVNGATKNYLFTMKVSEVQY